MVIDVAEVVLLALENTADRRIARVEKRLAVRLPGERASAGALDRVRQVVAGIDVANAERRLLAAVLGEAIGKQLAIAVREIPVEGDGAVLGEGVDVQEHPVLAIDAN